MATSGTTTFDLDIDDIIQEAYERTGARTNSGYDLKSARRSLNILFSEWGNRGVHLWKVELKEQLNKDSGIYLSDNIHLFQNKKIFNEFTSVHNENEYKIFAHRE